MEKSKQLVVLCGIPGSGKSTWAKTKNGKYLKIVSRDAIRFSLIGENDEYFSKETEVFNTFINEIKKALKEEEILTVIADATHINQASRTKLLRALGKSLKDVEVVGMYFDANENLAIEHNEERKGTRTFVPHAVIRRMACQFEAPTEKEGFDKIYNIKITTTGGYNYIRESGVD